MRFIGQRPERKVIAQEDIIQAIEVLHRTINKVSQLQGNVNDIYDVLTNMRRELDYLNECAQVTNYLARKDMEAPRVSMKKRRVTICAGGQTVEVIKI